jgi:ssDNA-binding Zn-finger/Zn-ribbon topoisomerase 1
MEPLRKCQAAQQFMPDSNGMLVPCDEYPSCPYCPPKLSSDKPGKDYRCSRCKAVSVLYMHEVYTYIYARYMQLMQCMA